MALTVAYPDTFMTGESWAIEKLGNSIKMQAKMVELNRFMSEIPFVQSDHRHICAVRQSDAVVFG
jgi:hypothetical protein